MSLSGILRGTPLIIPMVVFSLIVLRAADPLNSEQIPFRNYYINRFLSRKLNHELGMEALEFASVNRVNHEWAKF